MREHALRRLLRSRLFGWLPCLSRQTLRREEPLGRALSDDCAEIADPLRLAGVRVCATSRAALRETPSRKSGDESSICSSAAHSSIDCATKPVSPWRTIAISAGLFMTTGASPSDI